MNWPTIIVAAIVAIIFAVIVVSEIKKRKSGKNTCSCGCSSCAMKDQCHPEKK